MGFKKFVNIFLLLLAKKNTLEPGSWKFVMAKRKGAQKEKKGAKVPRRNVRDRTQTQQVNVGDFNKTGAFDPNTTTTSSTTTSTTSSTTSSKFPPGPPSESPKRTPRSNAGQRTPTKFDTNNHSSSDDDINNLTEDDNPAFWNIRCPDMYLAQLTEMEWMSKEMNTDVLRSHLRYRKIPIRSSTNFMVTDLKEYVREWKRKQKTKKSKQSAPQGAQKPKKSKPSAPEKKTKGKGATKSTTSSSSSSTSTTSITAALREGNRHLGIQVTLVDQSKPGKGKPKLSSAPYLCHVENVDRSELDNESDCPELNDNSSASDVGKVLIYCAKHDRFNPDPAPESYGLGVMYLLNGASVTFWAQNPKSKKEDLIQIFEKDEETWNAVLDAATTKRTCSDERMLLHVLAFWIPPKPIKIGRGSNKKVRKINDKTHFKVGLTISIHDPVVKVDGDQNPLDLASVGNSIYATTVDITETFLKHEQELDTGGCLKQDPRIGLGSLANQINKDLFEERWWDFNAEMLEATKGKFPPNTVQNDSRLYVQYGKSNSKKLKSIDGIGNVMLHLKSLKVDKESHESVIQGHSRTDDDIKLKLTVYTFKLNIFVGHSTSLSEEAQYPSRHNSKTSTPGKGRNPNASRSDQNSHTASSSSVSRRSDIEDKCKQLFFDEHPNNKLSYGFNIFHVEHLIRILSHRSTSAIDAFLHDGTVPTRTWTSAIINQAGPVQRGR